MKRHLISLLVFSGLVALSPVHAQVTEVNAARLAAEVNSLRADLEEARRLRDQEVAARWTDRKTANDEREAFNEKYRTAREQLDDLAAEKNRLMENLRATRGDLETSKSEAERARTAFVALSSQQDKLDGIAKLAESGIPWAVPQRIELSNRIRKEIGLYKDTPERAVSGLLEAGFTELAFTRQVEWSKGDVTFTGGATTQGQKVRLGGIGGIQVAAAPATGIAILLPSAGERGRVFTWQESLDPKQSAAVRTSFASNDTTSRVWLPVDILLSTTLSSEIATQTELSPLQAFEKFMVEGGYLMWPIFGLLVFGLLLAVERTVVLAWRGRRERRRLHEVMQLVEQGKGAEALAKANEGKPMIGLSGAVVRAALAGVTKGGRTASEKSIEEVFAREVPRLQRRLPGISVSATAAPLLGLLGTIVGMIQLFQVITMHGTNDPKLLAGGISVALLTTEFGLIVAIPMVLLHSWLTARVERLVNGMETLSLRILNGLWLSE